LTQAIRGEKALLRGSFSAFSYSEHLDSATFFRERLRKKNHLKFSVAKKFCVDLLDGSLSPGMPALVTAEEKLPA
jgi:hypothetical protein